MILNLVVIINFKYSAYMYWLSKCFVDTFIFMNGQRQFPGLCENHIPQIHPALVILMKNSALAIEAAAVLHV